MFFFFVGPICVVLHFRISEELFACVFSFEALVHDVSCDFVVNIKV